MTENSAAQGGHRGSDADIEPRRVRFSPPAPASAVPMEWIAIAAGSGIVGNLAYDMLKIGAMRALNGLRLPRRPVPEHHHHHHLLLARLAVQVRCNELDLPAPEIENLRMVHELHRDEVVEVFLRCEALSAKVVFPQITSRAQQPVVAVTLFTTTDTTIRRRRRNHFPPHDAREE